MKKRCNTTANVVLVVLFSTCAYLSAMQLADDFTYTENEIPNLIVIEQYNGQQRTIKNEELQIPSKKSLVMATLTRNNGRFLKEWITFHILMGFEFFIIFDHKSTDNTNSIMAPFIKSGRAILIHSADSFTECGYNITTGRNRQTKCQLAVFNYALQKARGKTEWLATFDIDEFLWTPQNSPPLIELLRTDFKHVSVLSITAFVFGNNHFEKSFQGLVTATHTRRAGPAGLIWNDNDELRYGRKTLFRSKCVSYVGIHSVLSRCSSHKRIEPSDNRLRMNHYRYLSTADQHAKANLNGNVETDDHEDINSMTNEVEDTGIQYIVPSLTKAMSQYDEIKI